MKLFGVIFGFILTNCLFAVPQQAALQRPYVGLFVYPNSVEVDLATIVPLLWSGDKDGCQQWAKSNRFLCVEVDAQQLAFLHYEVTYPNLNSWQNLLSILDNETTIPLRSEDPLFHSISTALSFPSDSVLLNVASLMNRRGYRYGISPYLRLVAEVKVLNRFLQVELDPLSSPFHWETLQAMPQAELNAKPPSPQNFPDWKVSFRGYILPSEQQSEFATKVFSELNKYHTQERQLIKDVVQQWLDKQRAQRASDYPGTWTPWKDLREDVQERILASLVGRNLDEERTLSRELLTSITNDLLVRFKVVGGYHLGMITPKEERNVYTFTFGGESVEIQSVDIQR